MRRRHSRQFFGDNTTITPDIPPPPPPHTHTHKMSQVQTNSAEGNLISSTLNSTSPWAKSINTATCRRGEREKKKETVFSQWARSINTEQQLQTSRVISAVQIRSGTFTLTQFLLQAGPSCCIRALAFH